MTEEELNKLIVLNTNHKTGEPLFLVSYPYIFKITYEESDSIKQDADRYCAELWKTLVESLNIEEE